MTFLHPVIGAKEEYPGGESERERYPGPTEKEQRGNKDGYHSCVHYDYKYGVHACIITQHCDLRI